MNVRSPKVAGLLVILACIVQLTFLASRARSDSAGCECWVPVDSNCDPENRNEEYFGSGFSYLPCNDPDRTLPYCLDPDNDASTYINLTVAKFHKELVTNPGFRPPQVSLLGGSQVCWTSSHCDWIMEYISCGADGDPQDGSFSQNTYYAGSCPGDSTCNGGA